jgi:hypothetical protein
MNLITEIKEILFNPIDKIKEIDQNNTPPSDYLKKIILPLMGVGLLASLLGFKFFARSGFFGNSWNTSMKYTLSFFLISLIQIFILPIIIDKISKTFKSESNIEKSKTFTYVALVPFFLSLILFIKPNIGNNVAPFVALYSFYLFYTAAPILKKTPKENLIPYVVSIVVVDLLIIYLSFVYVLQKLIEAIL